MQASHRANAAVSPNQPPPVTHHMQALCLCLPTDSSAKKGYPTQEEKGGASRRGSEDEMPRSHDILSHHSRLWTPAGWCSCSPGHWPSGQTWRMASQMWLLSPPKSARASSRTQISISGETYLTWTISRPSLTSCGRSLTSLRFWAGSSTVLTPARRAPISFSLIPPTAVMRPRREISPCVLWNEGDVVSAASRGSRV